ncbi:hypothetical protein [Hydrogenophaga sp. MI9]|uniref:hypothetical protein n=1 Tax=Hydrogenophaga sp. MI9 TaxID=3453719 RepID=UPI003EEB4A64
MKLEPLNFAVRAHLALPLPHEPVLLQVQRTPRPYPLKEFVQASPALDSDLARQSPGVPLTLALRLQDAQGQAIRRAAVYIWHYDPSCWTLDVHDDDLRTVALMRGVQVSDEHGDLVFHTVYPGRYVDNSVPVYLRVYFNDGRHVLARADGCLLLPTQPAEVASELQIAPAVLPTLRKPAPLDARSAASLRPDRVVADPEGGGLRAELTLRIDLDSAPRTH